MKERNCQLDVAPVDDEMGGRGGGKICPQVVLPLLEIVQSHTD